MEEKNLTEQESLLIIQQMINTAKQEQKDDGRGWILWGWLLFLASILTYVNLDTHWFVPYYFWNIFGGISLVLLLYNVVRYFFFQKRQRVRTYTGELFEKLNVGFILSLMLIIVAMNRGVDPLRGFPLLIGLYGFWVLIYGTALNFKPSIIAAYITWALGFAALFANSFQTVMLLHGVAVLCGYIIPGHIANREFKKFNRSVND
jgi:hypothetical protein